MVQMVYVQRKRQKQANHDKDMYELFNGKKRVAVEEPLEDGRMCGQDGCWGKRPAHAHIKSGERYKDTFGVEPFAQERQNLSRDEGIARNGRRKKKKKRRRGHLRGPAKVDNETDRAGGLGNSLVGLTLVGGGVGADNAGGAFGDGGALLTLVVANLHTGNVHVGELSDDAGNVPAGEAVVLGVAHVELTPGGGVLADEVGRETFTLGGTPTTLGVVIDGNEDAVTGLNGEAQSLVGAPETVQTAGGAVRVPHDDSPGLGVVVLEADNVLVLAGGVLFDTDHVATPGAADVADVVPVEGANALAGSGRTESGGGVLAVGGVAGPVAGTRRAGAGGGGGARGNGGGADGRDGLNGGGGLGGGSGSGSGSSGRLGDLGGRITAEPVVDPGDELAIDDSGNLLTTLLNIRNLGGSSHSGLDDLDVSGVGVTAVVAVKTSDSRPSGQRRHQQHRFGEMHFGRIELEKGVT